MYVNNIRISLKMKKNLFEYKKSVTKCEKNASL